MSWEKLLESTRTGETEQLKFLSKIDSDDDLGALIVAMANTNGGTIYLGLDINNYHLIGSDADINFPNYLCEKFCQPYLQVTTTKINKNSKDILCIIVPEGTVKPYYYKNACYIMENLKPALLKYAKSDIKSDIPESALFKQKEETKESKETEQSSQQSQEPETSTEESQASIEKPTSISATAQTFDWKNTEGAGIPDNLNQRQKDALEYIKQHDSIKNKKYRETFGISHKTAHLELADMVSKNYLQIQGSGRSTGYILAK
ncbi:RNA-binding domain-containing protein [Candidatus Margulisiibacteriota bacterium]